MSDNRPTIRHASYWAMCLPEWKEVVAQNPIIVSERTVPEVVAQIRQAKQEICKQFMILNKCELWLQNTLKEYQQEVKHLQADADHGIYREGRNFIDGLPTDDIVNDLN